MAKIAIISDTHGNVANFKKAVAWINKQGIRVILHCGDIGSPEVLKESLADFNGEFFGVLGNMDKDYKIDIKKYQDLPRIKINEEFLETELGGKRIAITHKPEPAKELAESGKYHFVFYGHTHKPCLASRSLGVGGGRKIKECLLVNPGELAGQLFKPTFAVYDSESGKLELKILELL